MARREWSDFTLDAENACVMIAVTLTNVRSMCLAEASRETAIRRVNGDDQDGEDQTAKVFTFPPSEKTASHGDTK